MASTNINGRSHPPKEASSTSSSSTGNRTLKSDVWNFLDYKPPSTAGRNDAKAVCTLCRRALSANNGGHLGRHIKSKSCAKVITDLYDQLVTKGLHHISHEGGGASSSHETREGPRIK